MKNLAIFGILAALLLATSPAYSQEDTDITTTELLEYLSDSGVVRTRTSRAVKGSPYFNTDWLKGHVMINEKATTETIYLRYNMENNTVEFTRDNKIYALSPNKIDGFIIYTQTQDIIFRNGFQTNDDDIKPSTLVRVVYDGNIKLLAHHTSSLKKNLATYGSATKRDEYVSDTDFYLVNSDGTFNEIRLRRRDILRTLSDKEDELKEFARANNLDYDEEPELIKILAHYDRITGNASSGD